jgi:hypothetical protein
MQVPSSLRIKMPRRYHTVHARFRRTRIRPPTWQLLGETRAKDPLALQNLEGVRSNAKGARYVEITQSPKTDFLQ